MFDQEKYIETFSQVRASEETLTEVLSMTKRNKSLSMGRFTRTLVAAAVITALLATTAFAYVGFTQYENPMQMLKTFFGSDEYSVDEGGYVRTETYYDLQWDIVEPTVEHVPVDPKAAEKVAPYISSVGESISFDDWTLTVEAHQYDSATNCGIIYYSLENPNGVNGYDQQLDGEVWWPAGELICIKDASEKSYIVEEETTDTKLTVAAYYCGADESDMIEIYFYADKTNALKLYLNDGGGMKFKKYDDSSIVISPIAIKLKLTAFDFLGRIDTDGAYVPPSDDARLDYLAVRYMDGTLYVIRENGEGSKIQNYNYALIEESDRDMSYVFNRIIDVDEVKSVIINDMEYSME